jgi:hypothetical protein
MSFVSSAAWHTIYVYGVYKLPSGKERAGSSTSFYRYLHAYNFARKVTEGFFRTFTFLLKLVVKVK